jgi:hypothetical protein
MMVKYDQYRLAASSLSWVGGVRSISLLRLVLCPALHLKKKSGDRNGKQTKKSRRLKPPG